MAKKQLNPIEQTKDYIAFLEKRVASENYRKNVTPAEYQDTKVKLDKERFKLRTLEAKGKGKGKKK